MKPETLKSKTEIKELFRKGKRETIYPLTVIYLPNDLGISRFLFCTDRGIKKAVDRNRIKRIFRALAMKANPPAGMDIALIAKSEFGLKKPPVREQLFNKLVEKISQ